MKRTDVLNHLAEKHQLKRYLEIGVQDKTQNYNKINCISKVSVDPDPNAKATYCMTSDDFFVMWSHAPGNFMWTIEEGKFDLIFIDGLHTAEQVKKDFENALKVLLPNGFIVLHDCNPEKEEYIKVPRPTKTGVWNGDVVRFAIQIHPYGYTVDVDHGCFVYHNTADNYDKILPPKWERKYLNSLRLGFSWEIFKRERKQQLNLITWDEFIKL